MARAGRGDAFSIVASPRPTGVLDARRGGALVVRRPLVGGGGALAGELPVHCHRVGAYAEVRGPWATTATGITAFEGAGPELLSEHSATGHERNRNQVRM